MKDKKEKKTNSRKTSSLKINLLGIDGKSISTVAVAEELFGVKVNTKLISQYVRVYLANQRHIYVATKTRAEIKGSTRKIYRQKGTGGARHGSKKAPIFVGGGVAHGPKKRSYQLTMNKKQKKQVFFQSLSLQFSQGNIYGLDDQFSDLNAKTKIFASFLMKANLINEKILLVLDFKKDQNLYRGMKNITNVTTISLETINPYLILQTSKLLFVGRLLKSLEKR